MIDNLEKFVTAYNDLATYQTIAALATEFKVTDRSIRRTAQKCRLAGVVLVDRSSLLTASVAAAVQAGNPVEDIEDGLDENIQVENIKLAKKVQRLQDTARLHNKSFRDTIRADNALGEVQDQLLAELKRLNLSKSTKVHKMKVGDDAYGIVHISDVHLNELIDLPHNKYDWTIAGKRMKKHVDAAKRIFGSYGIKNVLVAYTGDILNSDRRPDEFLGNAGNRAKACLLACDLYQQMLLDLNNDFNLTVAAVSGNESRLPKDVGWIPEVASDNYDFIIYEMLRRLLDSKGIRFLKNSDPGELVVRLGKQNLLLIHGHGAIENRAPDRSILQLKGRYLAHNKTCIDMVIWGHVHSCIVGDSYARSSSMCGSNDYAEKALGLSGRASQNLYVISEANGFDGMKIDLQNTENVTGYSIQTQLEEYNTKSADKASKTIMIHSMMK